ncbi:hypothetical protein [Paraburkholderia gardini]|uniref:hypothetical protein n=1 Tax=Paraburkholderia gardini TaxID=2823469 RepID=UPI001E371B01|nr:hypothetical protein [Paraburkholderia gardini]
MSTIVSGVEAKTRTWLHERHLKCDPNGVPKNPEYVKFALKEVSVADMDRYRFKVEHAISELNAALSSWPSMQDKAEKLGGRCTAKVDVALKIAQAERRLDIFDGKVLELQCLMKACTKWSEELRDSVNTTKSDTTKSFLKLEQDQGWNATGHENCGDYCLYDGGSVSTTWDKFKKDAASVIKQLQDPIDPESLLSLNKTSFTKADQVKANYE